jgi:hypothetical protein
VDTSEGIFNRESSHLFSKRNFVYDDILVADFCCYSDE